MRFEGKLPRVLSYVAGIHRKVHFHDLLIWSLYILKKSKGFKEEIIAQKLNSPVSISVNVFLNYYFTSLDEERYNRDKTDLNPLKRKP